MKFTTGSSPESFIEQVSAAIEEEMAKRFKVVDLGPMKVVMVTSGSMPENEAVITTGNEAVRIRC